MYCWTCTVIEAHPWWPFEIWTLFKKLWTAAAPPLFFQLFIVQTRKNFSRGAAAPHPAISPVFPAQHQIAALIEILTQEFPVSLAQLLGSKVCTRLLLKIQTTWKLLGWMSSQLLQAPLNYNATCACTHFQMWMKKMPPTTSCYWVAVCALHTVY